MDKIILNRRPFTGTAEIKYTKADNKPYLSIGFAHSHKTGQKTADGKDEYKSNWNNYFDKRDLLVQAELSMALYNAICEAEAADRNPGNNSVARTPDAIYGKDNEHLPL